MLKSHLNILKCLVIYSLSVVVPIHAHGPPDWTPIKGTQSPDKVVIIGRTTNTNDEVSFYNLKTRRFVGSLVPDWMRPVSFVNVVSVKWSANAQYVAVVLLWGSKASEPSIYRKLSSGKMKLIGISCSSSYLRDRSESLGFDPPCFLDADIKGLGLPTGGYTEKIGDLNFGWHNTVLSLGRIFEWYPPETGNESGVPREFGIKYAIQVKDNQVRLVRTYGWREIKDEARGWN